MNEVSPPRTRRQEQLLLWIVMFAVAWRWVLAMRTPVPSEDGANYLWMAQRFAAGDLAAGLSEVFPPGLSLLIAPLLRFGVEALMAGQIVGCVCGGLAVLPVAFAAERLQRGALLPAAVLFATTSLLCRSAAEVYSESPFLLLMALGTLAGLHRQHWRLGIFAGLGYLLRPEALLLPIAFVTWDRRALRSLLPAALGVGALALLRGFTGNSFDPLPILAFHDGRDDLPGRGAFLRNLLDVPWAYGEAFGPLCLLPLLLIRRTSAAARPLLVQLLLNALVICTFVVRRRFFLSAAVSVVALAAAGLCRLRLPLRVAVVVLCAGFGLGHAWWRVTPQDRLAEKAVGRYLARQLHGDELVAGDLTRVLFYAGLRPLPPRHFDTGQLLAMAAPPAVRYVVLSADSKRGTYAATAAGLDATFARLGLPARLQQLADESGIAVFVRR